MALSSREDGAAKLGYRRFIAANLDAPKSFDYVWFTPRHSDEDPAFTKAAR